MPINEEDLDEVVYAITYDIADQVISELRVEIDETSLFEIYDDVERIVLSLEAEKVPAEEWYAHTTERYHENIGYPMGLFLASQVTIH